MPGQSSGRAGFGTQKLDPRSQKPLTDEELLAAAGDTTTLLQQIARNTGRLADRYVEDPLSQPQQIFIVASAVAFAFKVDFSNQPHNSYIISVTTGTLNMFFGDYVGIGQATNPHLQYAAGSTDQKFLPLLGRVYTIINPSTTVNLVACLTPLTI